MKRPYKKAWSDDAAFDYIAEQAGTHFDPELVYRFLSIKDDIIRTKQYWNSLEQRNELPSMDNVLPVNAAI